MSFQPASFDAGAKSLYGTVAIPDTTGAAADVQVAGVRAAVDAVLAHSSHAQFLMRKLWAEFIASPIPSDALASLVAAYTADGALALRPLIRGILTHPLIFESLDEPNLVKPPVVYLVGLMRALGAPMKGSHMRVASTNMQQVAYKPPNVAGWEGGLSWFNTNTVQGRFDAAVRALYLNYSTYYPGQAPLADPGAQAGADAVDAAHASVGRPWLSAATRDYLASWADAAAADTAAHRRQRFYTLQALILGGPDGQVIVDALHRVRGDRARPRARRAADADAARAAARRWTASRPGAGARSSRAGGCCSGAWPGSRRSTPRTSSAGTRCGSRWPPRPRTRRRGACCCSIWPAATTA